MELLMKYTNEIRKSFYSLNKKVVCKPFDDLVIDTVIKSGFAMIEQKVNFLTTQVLFTYMDDELFPVIERDCQIWVSGECINHEWAKKKYIINDQEIILVPFEMILFAKDNECEESKSLTN